MTYDPKQFPHYGELRFPHHLRADEIVWAGEWIGGGVDFAGVRSSGPFTVVQVQDRPESVAPLVTVRDQKLGREHDLCATMLTRVAPSGEKPMFAGLIALFKGKSVRITHTNPRVSTVEGVCAMVHDMGDGTFDVELGDGHRISFVPEEITASSVDGPLPAWAGGRRKVEIV